VGGGWWSGMRNRQKCRLAFRIRKDQKACPLVKVLPNHDRHASSLSSSQLIRRQGARDSHACPDALGPIGSGGAAAGRGSDHKTKLARPRLGQPEPVMGRSERTSEPLKTICWCPTRFRSPYGADPEREGPLPWDTSWPSGCRLERRRDRQGSRTSGPAWPRPRGGGSRTDQPAIEDLVLCRRGRPVETASHRSAPHIRQLIFVMIGAECAMAGFHQPLRRVGGEQEAGLSVVNRVGQTPRCMGDRQSAVALGLHLRQPAWLEP
jgi:hypothetical protein